MRHGKQALAYEYGVRIHSVRKANTLCSVSSGCTMFRIPIASTALDAVIDGAGGSCPLTEMT